MQEKNADRQIEHGIEALRAERAPSHDVQGVKQRLATRPTRTLATVGVATVTLAAAAIAFLPRPSAAADLDELERAVKTLPPRQEVHLVATTQGQYEVALEIYVDSDEVVLQGNDQGKQTWKNDRLTTEFGTYATVQDSRMPDWTTKTFLLSDWIRQAVPNTVERKTVKAADVIPLVALSRNVTIDPQLVLQRVAFDIKLDSERQGHVVFNVEPTTLRPVLVQAQIAGEKEVKVVLGYQLQNIELQTTKPTETYDLDKQRQEIIDSFAAPIASTLIEGINVVLHKAIVDHEGNLTFIYSGTEPLPSDLDKARIIEGQADGPTLSIMPQSTRDGVHYNNPVPYGQLQVAIVSVRTTKPTEVPSILAVGSLLSGRLQTLREIHLPVTIKGIVRWARFTDVPVMRTGSTLQLLAPENVPFWTKGQNPDGATTRSE